MRWTEGMGVQGIGTARHGQTHVTQHVGRILAVLSGPGGPEGW